MHLPDVPWGLHRLAAWRLPLRARQPLLFSAFNSWLISSYWRCFRLPALTETAATGRETSSFPLMDFHLLKLSFSALSHAVNAWVDGRGAEHSRTEETVPPAGPQDVQCCCPCAHGRPPGERPHHFAPTLPPVETRSSSTPPAAAIASPPVAPGSTFTPPPHALQQHGHGVMRTTLTTALRAAAPHRAACQTHAAATPYPLLPRECRHGSRREGLQ